MLKNVRPLLTQVITLVFVAVLAASCRENSSKDDGNDRKDIPGQWLILYPQHILKTASARKAYTRDVQDSIIGMAGLKLIALRSNGEFRQGDSILDPPGRWMVRESGEFLIDGGGEGFRKFRGQFEGIRNDTMMISENLVLPEDTVKVIWHLKRLDDQSAKFFFNIPANWWRQKPVSGEDHAALARRLRAMLEYYSVYYSVVSKESAYFLQSRVPLPFQYYQHAMSLKAFSEKHPFNQFFYYTEDARSAYGILNNAMKKMEKEQFPGGTNFVAEYAAFMKKVRETIPEQ